MGVPLHLTPPQMVGLPGFTRKPSILIGILQFIWDLPSEHLSHSMTLHVPISPLGSKPLEDNDLVNPVPHLAN